MAHTKEDTVLKEVGDIEDSMETYAKILATNKPNPLGPGYIKLYLLSAVVFLCSTMNGFDSSLMGSINALPNYISYFDLPENGNASTGIVFAIFQVGQMCGALFIWMTDWYGRTWHIFFGCLGVCIGTIITSLATSLPIFIAGRFLLSFFATCGHTAAPLYLVEIAPPIYRGTIAGMYNTFYNVGSVFSTSAVYACHKYLSHHGDLDWRLPLWLQMVCPGLVCLVIKFYPESPRWLVSNDRHDEAQAIIATYHTNGDAEHPLVALQMREMLATVDREYQASWKDFFDLRVLVESRSSRYRLMLNIAFSWFGQFSGNNIVSYYLPIMLNGIGITDTNLKLILNIVYAVIGWVASIFSSRLHDVVGRRKMLMGTTAGMTVCLAIVAACAAGYTEYGNQTASTVTIVFIFKFGAIFACGFTPMQPIYPAEVVSNRMRAKAMGTFKLTAGAAGFLNTFVSPIALSNIGYWFYVFFVFWDTFELAFMYLFFVETKGSTLEELDVFFEAKNPRKASVEAVKARKRIIQEQRGSDSRRVRDAETRDTTQSEQVMLRMHTPQGFPGLVPIDNGPDGTRRAGVRRQWAVLQVLFPHATLDDLVDKDRAELIRLLSKSSSTDTDLPTERFGVALSVSDCPENAHDALEESDEADDSEDRHWDESAKDPATLATSDDINAIGLAGDRRRRSYLGICSVGAVLKTLFRLCPSAKACIIKDFKLWAPVQPDDTRPTLLPQGPVITPSSDSLRELRYITFYFDNVQAITPFLHEESFRVKFTTRDQQGSSWLGLCNMVLTVGSIASGSDTAHIHYYNRARSYLNLDSLGSGNLETLQALCLLGGYYLHYRNSPNMAYSILGAAQRLAIALGLHREPPVRNEQPDPEARGSYVLRLETRRRTWWSLYCLDTWATSLRPINRISVHEAQALDYDLQRWYDGLHPVLQHTIDAPPRMTVAREFLRNRYYNARLILSRCFLLYMTYEDTTRLHPHPAEQQMASLCRSIAGETIDAIALYWVPNRTQVWNAAWYLFQACMVPLLSIAMANMSDPAAVDPADVSAWYASLHKALEAFSEMRPWMRTSDRAPNIVAVLLRAMSQGPDGSIHTPSVTDGALNLFGMSDEFLIEMDWSELPNDENIFQSPFPLT
ncbi:lactose permease [Aspergillus terreus]|uniref:Lactose permease n=1 Tax=Aspergillus terreus TaxID=33178 RepID=A0A5M3ZCU7_ASPTE|nr:hypothetical protein ATETN484_0014039800 [Aspergillus terreus]GFF21064.1 lactose permease [Aspergillus terreus]